METDTAHVGAALITTRAVRRRLDLVRNVDDQTLLDCVDIAEQAPAGGNLSSRRWLIIRDPAVRADQARLDNEWTGPWMAASAERLAGSGQPQEKVTASAAFMAAHLAEVPPVIVTIVARHYGSARRVLFDAGGPPIPARPARGGSSTWSKPRADTAAVLRHDRAWSVDPSMAIARMPDKEDGSCCGASGRCAPPSRASAGWPRLPPRRGSQGPGDRPVPSVGKLC